MKYLSILDQRGARIPITALSGDNEGAATGRRMRTWGLSSPGPSQAVFSSLSTLRSRSRELIRNNPLADGGTDSYVASLIGSGINPRWKLADDKLRDTIHTLWDDWIDEADFNETTSFYGLQSLIARGLIDAGEILVQEITLPSSSKLSVPIQFKVFEADHLDESYSTYASNGNEIRMGIEIDAMGKRVAYHLWPDHPGEYFIGQQHNFERRRVPAEQIMHIFKPVRAGQMRGRPWLSSIIVKLHELDQYDDAELVRKKGAAMFGGFIYQDAPNQEDADPTRIFGREDDDDENDNPVIAFEPGTFPRLPAGLKVEFSNPPDVGNNYKAWMEKQLRDVARGIGITYEQLTGDLSNVNFSSLRAGLTEMKRRVKQLQRETIIFQFCRSVAMRWINTAVLAGRLTLPRFFQNPRPYYKINWNPDEWESANPRDDAETDVVEINAGLASRTSKAAARGRDVEVIDRENKIDKTREKTLGLEYQKSTPPPVPGKGESQIEPPIKKGKDNGQEGETVSFAS